MGRSYAGKHVKIKKKRRYLNRKMGSVFLIMALVLVGVPSVLIFNPLNESINAGSAWTQGSDEDFIGGTLINLTIEGSGNNAELKIESTGSNHWTKRIPASTTAPFPRAQHGLAAVYGTAKFVLQGYHSSSHDTWVYDMSKNTWMDMDPTSKPTKRSYHEIAPMYGTDKVLLFGGYDGSNNLNDTWIYDLSENNWTKMQPTTSPSARYHFTLSSIYGDDKVILFGGSQYPGYTFDDTWVYDLSDKTWTNKLPSTKPSQRWGYSMANIYGTDKVVLFGGSNGWDETWVYDLNNNTWTKKTPNVKPSMRYKHEMVTIPHSSEVMLFGGAYGSTQFQDTWIYDINNGTQGTWTEKILNTKPELRDNHEMASSYYDGRILLFGGYRRYFGFLNDTWIFRSSIATKNGSYLSSVYETNPRPDFSTLEWTADIPFNTDLKFQLRSAQSKKNLTKKPFVGPDGNSNSYYISSPATIWSGHDGENWIQFKVDFILNSISTSPVLKNIKISYNCLPELSVLGPMDGSVITNNKPTFTWQFEDFDSDHQVAFQLIIAKDYGFENIIYDTGPQASAEQSWTFTSGTTYKNLPDGTWYWKVRVMDEDNCWTEYSQPAMLQVDSQIPNSAVLTPINNRYYNALDKISGVALDPESGSGLNRIEITIMCLGDNLYWNGSGWSSFSTWLIVTGTTNWYYDSSTIPWSNGQIYKIKSRAIDNATNIENSDITTMFSIDQENPISIITSPKINTWLTSLDSISGICEDIRGSGIESVEVIIRCVTEDEHWDGSGWSKQKTWLTVVGTEDWLYDTSIITWTTGHEYSIQSRAIDKVGNTEPPEHEILFWYDDSAPEELEVYINNGDKFTTSTEVELSLHADDSGSGVHQMAFSNDGVIWSDWEPFAIERTFTLKSNNGEKLVYFRVQDYTGNIATPVADTIVLDTEPPGGLSIIINNGDKYTSSKQLMLTFQATEQYSGLNGMSISYDAINWLPWEPFSEAKSIQPYSSDGEKTIYYRVKDGVGNIAEPVYDSIIVDTTPPRLVGFAINNGALETNTTDVALEISAVDRGVGLEQMTFSLDGETWSPWELFSPEKQFTLPPEVGEHTIYVRVRDKLGHTAEPTSANVILNISAPTSLTPTTITPTESDTGVSNLMFTIIALSIIIMICIITAFTVVKKRKNKREQVLPTTRNITIKPGHYSSLESTTNQVPAAAKPVQLAQPPVAAPVMIRPTIQALQTAPQAIPQVAQAPQVPQLPPATEQYNGNQTNTPTPKITVQLPSVEPQSISAPKSVNGPLVHLP
jgi:hypothetical protein